MRYKPTPLYAFRKRHESLSRKTIFQECAIFCMARDEGELFSTESVERRMALDVQPQPKSAAKGNNHPMNSIQRKLLCLVLSFAASTVPSVASTLNYSEFTDAPGHDLSADANFIGYLDVGKNTVSGTIFNWAESGGPDPDTDVFLVATGAGTEVVSEEISLSATGNASSISILDSISGSTDITGDVDNTITLATPITGLLGFRIQGTPVPRCSGPNDTPPCSYASVGYTVTYTVQAIPDPPSSVAPEPSTFLLLGTGLAGLTGIVKSRLAA